MLFQGHPMDTHPVYYCERQIFSFLLQYPLEGQKKASIRTASLCFHDTRYNLTSTPAMFSPWPQHPDSVLLLLALPWDQRCWVPGLLLPAMLVFSLSSTALLDLFLFLVSRCCDLELFSLPLSTVNSIYAHHFLACATNDTSICPPHSQSGQGFPTSSVHSSSKLHLLLYKDSVDHFFPTLKLKPLFSSLIS